MEKNLFNGMYDAGNMMMLASQDSIKNNKLYSCTDCFFENDDKKYDYLLPVKLRVILMYINDECDKYEYEGSPMFDELPDRRFMDSIVKKIMADYEKNEKDNNDFVDNNSELLIYALLSGTIVYRKDRHNRIVCGLN